MNENREEREGKGKKDRQQFFRGTRIAQRRDRREAGARKKQT